MIHTRVLEAKPPQLKANSFIVSRFIKGYKKKTVAWKKASNNKSSHKEIPFPIYGVQKGEVAQSER